MHNLVFSNMLHRPARSVVSILGIGIGILLIVFTVGLANGSLRERAQREANVGAEIMLRPSGSIGMSGSDALRLPISLQSEIEKTEGIERAVPIAQNTVSAKDTNTGNRLVDAINFDEYADLVGLQIVEGRRFSDRSDEVITDTAWLAQKKLKIGDALEIYDRDFKIVGTYEPSAGGRIKISLSTMQAQLGAEDKASAFLVKVKKGFNVKQAAEILHAKFSDRQIVLTEQLEELYMQSVPALSVFLNVVIGVAGVISALIILLTMYTTVTERTRQIGILKSLGMPNFSIALIIIEEALLISLSGIAAGITLTLILKFVLARWTTLNVQIETYTILLIIIVGSLSALAGALYPAWRAARLDAVEALNYE